ncbi:2OG-Fe(II) oxygenase [Sphingopyxis sp. MSC1_008]|uniref:2OG-Fe(II) oxygenase n=1 Tax=Sphingopyxis sp. MSC1_008 TaxID=2909265 RepID=UPI0020BD9356
MADSQSLTVRAEALLNAGAVDDAVQLAATAARNGDADALHLLGLWHVYGEPVGRNFAAARRLFGLAADAGHSGAAITHAVFVALGAGGSAPDWQDAVRLLRIAAENDGAAARQVALLDSMALDKEGSPRQLPETEALSLHPQVGVLRGLFTAAECTHVVALADPLLTPSIIVDSKSGKSMQHPIRTSFGAVLGPIQQDLVVHALNLRIAAATQTSIDQGEPLVILRYEPGQQYREHHDGLPGEPNQRSKTVIVYLNEDYVGGETSFPAADLAIKGREGDAISFVNTRLDGRIDERSRHAGQPVQRGQKWVCTRWIREKSFDPWGLRTPSPYVRAS